MVIDRPGAAIVGVGGALPAREVTNDELGLTVSDDWIHARTGIRSRRHLEPGEPLVDLAGKASEAALADAGVAADDLDLVIVSTLTADRRCPNLSAELAAWIGASRAAVMDISAACPGWLSALSLAAAIVEAGRAERVLVVAAERQSNWQHAQPSKTGALFGDGAGAVVVLRNAGASRIHPMIFGNDAGEREMIVVEPRDGAITVEMDGPAVFEYAVERLVESTRAALRAARLELGDIDLIAFHQANARIVLSAAARLGLRDDERVLDVIEHVGNISSASLPHALSIARLDGRLGRGTRVLFATVGGGLAWGAGVVEWGAGDE